MGLSISAATAILFISATLAFTGLFAAATGAQDILMDGHDDYLERMDGKLSTHLSITDVDADRGIIRAVNDGSTTLDLRKIHLLLDGHVSNDRIVSTSVDGREGTDIWMPGEALEIEVDGVPTDARICIIAGNGAAAYA